MLETSVGIGYFIILYINFRPVLPHNSGEIAGAFENICRTLGDGDSSLPFGELKSSLLIQGECIGRGDLEELLRVITNGSRETSSGDGHVVDAGSFASDILVFINEIIKILIIFHSLKINFD